MSPSTPSSARSVNGEQRVTSLNTHATPPNPALRGASLAFQALQAPPKPLTNTYSGSHGALAAATKAGMGAQNGIVKTAAATFQLHASSPHEPPRTPVRESLLKRATSGSVETLSLSANSTSSSRQQSPSHIAATIAAARSTPTPADGRVSFPNATKQARSRGQSTSVLDQKDETSIPATNALVQLFETRYGSDSTKPDAKKKVARDVTKSIPNRHVPQPRHIASPTPIRPPIALRLSSRSLNDGIRAQHGGFDEAPNASADEDTYQKSFASSQTGIRSSSPFTSIKHPPTKVVKIGPTLPPPRGKRLSSSITLKPVQAINLHSGLSDSRSSISSSTSANTMLTRTSIHNRPLSSDNSRPLQFTKPLSAPTFPTKLSPPPLPTTKPPLSRHASSRSFSSIITTPRLVPQLTADSLANAIVASSLASSRATSPTKSSFAPYQHNHNSHHSRTRSHHLLLPSHPYSSSHPSSPSKYTHMRHTLRAEKSAEDEDEDEGDERRRKTHMWKKHPNKHAEGDRKRWRDSVTERERKRYEGVWAANKGLLLSKASSDYVHALVVKDILTRSGLGSTTLAEVWDLVAGYGYGHPDTPGVSRPRRSSEMQSSGNTLMSDSDTRGKRYLTREEFVVSLWLVDQCLKGRKLPVSVGESVWESVRGLTGVRLHVSGRGKR